MTSPSTITMVNQKLYIVSNIPFSQNRVAALQLKIMQDWQNPPDVVATQGIYLVHDGGTPVFRDPNEAEFAAKLEKRLEFLTFIQACRRNKYHEAADEWPVGRTPPEVIEKSAAELKALMELWDVTSDDENDKNDTKIGSKIKSRKKSVQIYWEDPPDIVATQGIYLISGEGTPVIRDLNEAEFATELERRLRQLTSIESCRRNDYQEAADEWSMEHTPPEVGRNCNAELRTRLKRRDVISREDSGRNNGNNTVAHVGINPEKTVAASGGSRKTPSQADRLPTPPLSAESPLATPHRRKRRRKSGDEGKKAEEKERPTKTSVSSTKEVFAADNAVPSTSQDRGRKRPRSLDVSDEEEGNRGRSTKVRTSKNIGHNG